MGEPSVDAVGLLFGGLPLRHFVLMLQFDSYPDTAENAETCRFSYSP